MRTAASSKISITMGKEELRRAKTLAQSNGVSLSAIVTQAMRDYLAEQERRQAADEILASYREHDWPNEKEQAALAALWFAPRAAKTRPKRRR